MHGQMKLKFANAQQAKYIHKFHALKKKLLKTTAAIWFNKTCRNLQLNPIYISIGINRNNKRDRNTLRAATLFRIKQEIKFLHFKKTRLNAQLYNPHLQCASKWSRIWPFILDITDHNLQDEIDMLYAKVKKN
jgi:hypothetical protein